MTLRAQVRRLPDDIVVAFQFLTRIPMPTLAFAPGSLARAVTFFPLVGLAIGAGAGLLHMLLVPHLNRFLAALAVVLYLVIITGALHEDGLADTVDGLGGGWTRDQRLAILRDSRIGSYGAAALALSLLARVLLLASIPIGHFAQYIITAHVLCRWSTLPLSRFLPPARVNDGQGARLAKLTSPFALITGSAFALAVAGVALRRAAIAPLVAAMLITYLSGRVYMSKLGGVTGDCFGATNQITEIAVYVCGAWIA